MDNKTSMYLYAIDQMCIAGKDIIKKIEELGVEKTKNAIAIFFIQKTIRLVQSLKCLLVNGFSIESQILARTLFEIRVKFEYITLFSDYKFEELFQKFWDCILLAKIRLLESVNYSILSSDNDMVNKDKWIEIKEKIENRYPKEILKKMLKYGFTCMSLYQCAKITNNLELYNLVYRTYSQQIHVYDASEHLAPYLLETNIK